MAASELAELIVLACEVGGRHREEEPWETSTNPEEGEDEDTLIAPKTKSLDCKRIVPTYKMVRCQICTTSRCMDFAHGTRGALAHRCEDGGSFPYEAAADEWGPGTDQSSEPPPPLTLRCDARAPPTAHLLSE